MIVDEILKQLGSELGLGQLALNDEGLCQLIVDDVIEIDLEAPPGDHAFYLSTAIGPYPESGRAAAYAELLAANVSGQIASRGFFALDDEDARVVLCRRFDGRDLDYGRFKRTLEAFIDDARRWRGRALEETLGTGEAAASMHELLQGGRAEVIRG